MRRINFENRTNRQPEGPISVQDALRILDNNPNPRAIRAAFQQARDLDKTRWAIVKNAVDQLDSADEWVSTVQAFQPQFNSAGRMEKASIAEAQSIAKRIPSGESLKHGDVIDAGPVSLEVPSDGIPDYRPDDPGPKTERLPRALFQKPPKPPGKG